MKKCSHKDKPEAKCCKVINEKPIAVEIGDEAYMLTKADEYIPPECIAKEIEMREKKIHSLAQKLSEAKKIDAEVNGEIYWPLSRLPKEVSLLGEGQYLLLKCSGRVQGNKVIIEDVNL